VHEITGIARSTIGRGLDELEESILPEVAFGVKAGTLTAGVLDVAGPRTTALVSAATRYARRVRRVAGVCAHCFASMATCAASSWLST